MLSTVLLIVATIGCVLAVVLLVALPPGPIAAALILTITLGTVLLTWLVSVAHRGESLNRLARPTRATRATRAARAARGAGGAAAGAWRIENGEWRLQAR
jgi:hypothetical protein